jgi:hypothetical protein
MDERIKQDVTMFLVVLVACLLFVGAVETFTGVLSQTKEKNTTNQEVINSITDTLQNNLNNSKNSPKTPDQQLT